MVPKSHFSGRAYLRWLTMNDPRQNGKKSIQSQMTIQFSVKNQLFLFHRIYAPSVFYLQSNRYPQDRSKYTYINEMQNAAHRVAKVNF